LIDAGAEVVVTGRIGPKVMNVMSAQGISIFLVNGGTVRDAFEQYKQEQTANG